MAKAPKKTEKEIRLEEIKNILKETNPEFKRLRERSGEQKNVNTTSKEYRTFKEEEIEKKLSIYEKLCNLSEALNMEPEKEMKKKIQRAIDFSHLRITPKGAFSFSIIVGIFLLLVDLIMIILGYLQISNGLIFLALSVGAFFFFAKYPEIKADIFRIQASQEIILAILYMAIYMRSNPQMEGAINFAAKNLSGPMAYDLRKIIWDVETRRYETIYDAMKEYLERWYENREFIEAIHLMNTSLEQPESKRHQMLDEAINIILIGTEEKMKHFSETLRTPIMVIFSLGITLPILVLVMFPIMMLMLSDTIKPSYLIVGYDIVLPSLIYVISSYVLTRRPISYSTPDISLHPKYSPVGKIKITISKKEYYMPVWPIGVIISVPLIAIGLFVMFMDNSAISFSNLVGSIVVLWGLGIGFAVVFIIDSGKKIHIRNQIKKIQDEFGEALFQLGNRLALGNPFEKAMEQTVKKSRELKISDLFNKALINIRRSNMALESALFDKEKGAIWEYPSKLVINIMKIILDSSKKGVKNAAISAMSISRYVKQIHRIEEQLNEMMSESSSSMRLLGMFIAPLISGVTVTLTAIMMLIFDALGRTMGTLDLSEGGTGAGMGGMGDLLISNWGSVSEIISLGEFQLVVGIYMLEICYLLSYLVAGIENGMGDKIERRSTAGWTIIIGLTIYSLSVIFTYFMFVPMVSMLVT